MISIITTSYNYADYISETIKSVLAQTFLDWELIIVDDASSDNSVEVIRQFQDERIKLICHNENMGLKQAVLTGLQHAQGEWVAFLESDDTWMPQALEKRMEIISQHPEINLVFNDVELFGDAEWIKVVSNNVKNTKKKLLKKTFPKCIFKDLNIHNLILTFSSVMIRKQTLDILNFNTPIDKLLDWFLYIQAAYKNSAFYIPEKLTGWRIHKQSYISRKKGNRKLFANISAYLEIYKTRKYDLFLLIFIVYSFVLMFFTRTRFYLIVLIRKIKTILGIKKRKSPLFND